MAEAIQHEQKLWLILFQIKAIRARLNSLAVQHGLFWTLALAIGAAAGIVGAALTLGPLTFFVIAMTLVVTACIGIFAVVRSAWRMRASPARAAAIADSRTDLKGRLATVHALATRGHQSFLWPYLVEDTYGARQSFEPSRVEPRWFSRSVWALIVALLLAGLVLDDSLMSRIRGASIAASGSTIPETVTADINNLDIRSADPALAPNAEIYADPATLKKLQDRIAQENARNGGLSKLVDKARSFAGNLQGDIAGRPQNQPPVQMHLTDKSGQPDDGNASREGNPPGAQADSRNRSASGAGQDNQGDMANQPPPDGAVPPSNGLAANSGVPGPQNPADTPNGQPPDSKLTDGEGQGSDHGSGSDPSSLFGQPSAQELGSDNFKIAIDAEPSTEASGPGSPGYLPPRVRIPINPSQYPDEPLARGSIPAADQMTIKRVFER